MGNDDEEYINRTMAARHHNKSDTSRYHRLSAESASPIGSSPKRTPYADVEKSRSKPSEQYDQPLDFSKKRPETQSFARPPFSPLSPAGPEPPCQILSLNESAGRTSSRLSSPGDMSGDESSYANVNSENEESPQQQRMYFDKPPPGMPCVSQLSQFAFNTLFHESVEAANKDRAGDAMNHTALHPPGLLTTVPPQVPLLMGFNDTRKTAKYTRPFKAYPRDPLAAAAASMGMYPSYPVPVPIPLPPETMATQNILSTASDQAYLQFRQQVLATKRAEAQRKLPSGTRTIGNNGNLFIGHHSSNSEGESNEAGPRPSPQFQESVNAALINCSRRSDMEDSSGEEKMCNAVGTSSNLPPDDGNCNPNGGNGHLATSSSRKRNRSLPEELKDEAYWERRRKNNEAAKRSRDARRAKEDEIAIRAAYLEQENLKLRVELASLRNETNKLRQMVYTN